MPLHEEEHGKLFPDANRSRVVLEALLDEAARRGVVLRAGERVRGGRAARRGLRACGPRGSESRRARVVLATGGLSLPKTGSDGHGLRMAEALGHTVVPTTPALVPLVLAGAFHAPLSGVAHEVELTVRAGGRVVDRRTGSLLWTHFGVSGPVVLDASRAWLRARLEGREPALEANLLPGRGLRGGRAASWSGWRAASPRLARRARARRAGCPRRWREAVARESGPRRTTPLGRLRAGRAPRARARPRRARAARSWTAAATGSPRRRRAACPSPRWTRARWSRGGGPGLFLVGEMLDVDGRIGGFNFQWAWSSAWVAAGGLARGL